MGDEHAIRRLPGDRDPAPAAEVDEPFIAQGAEGTQDRVAIHAQLGREVARCRQALARRGLTVCDRPPDPRRNLLVELGRIAATLQLDAAHGATHNSFIGSVRDKPGKAALLPPLDDEAQALFEEARERGRRRRRNARIVLLLVAGLAVAILVARAGRDEGTAPSADDRTVAPRPPATRLFLQLLTGGEPLAVVDPASGTLRLLELPTAGGDWLDRLHRTGDRFVWQGPGGTYAIDADLRGPFQRISRWAFLPSARDGRVWFIVGDQTRRGRPLSAIEMTVRGEVKRRLNLGRPCRGPIVQALASTFVCQEDRSLLAFDLATGKTLSRVAGLFPFAADGTILVSCGRRCDAVRLTDIRTGRQASVEPPAPYRPVVGYDGAFSPDGRLVAVPVAPRGVAGTSGRLRVALVDVRHATAQVIPGSRLAADYRKLAWSSSGELFFATGGGRLMRYRPGAARAEPLSVKLPAPVLDIAAR